MNKEELIFYGQSVELSSWNENGRNVDGAPYTCGKDVRDFLNEAWLFFGDGNRLDGIDVVARMVEQRKKDGEVLADPYCGNWQLWTVLNELGLTRVRK